MALEHLINLYDQLLLWLKEHSYETYEAVLGNLSTKEWTERKILAISNLGEETNFEYNEGENNEPFLVDLFNEVRFITKTSESFEERKNKCILQTLFVLIMSGNYTPDQQIVIAVENKEHCLIYRIFYKSDFEAGIFDDVPQPSTALELPFKTEKHEYVYH